MSYGQLKQVELPKSSEIGKITPLGQKSMYCDKVGDFYMFFYRDDQYEHITEWESFTIENEQDFNMFYDIVMDNFSKIPKDPILLENSVSKITLIYKNLWGTRTMRFSNGVGMSSEFTKKQVQRLFGKR
tara:strand:+ start:241 stop:627 length:387 start_codon:yes stop_codon:yes gene_type:complete